MTSRAQVVVHHVAQDRAYLLQVGRLPRQDPLGRLGVAEDGGQGLVQLVGQGPRQLAQDRHARKAGQLVALPRRVQLGLPPLGDVDAAPDVAQERPVRGAPGDPVVQHPPILPVPPAHAVVDRERPPLAERPAALGEAAAHVLRVHALRPAIAELFFQRAAREVQPALVEERAPLLRIRHPDHDRRRVGHGVEERLAVPRRLFGAPPLAMGAVAPGEAGRAQDETPRPGQGERDRDPAHADQCGYRSGIKALSRVPGLRLYRDRARRPPRSRS